MNKKIESKLLLLLSLLLIQQFMMVSASNYEARWDYNMRTTFNWSNIDLFEHFNATDGFKYRQSKYLNDSAKGDDINAVASQIYKNMTVSDEGNDNIELSLDKIYNYEDTMDFRMQSLTRLLYLDINKSLIDSDVKDDVCDALGKSKYWYTEPSDDTAIFFTENHQILYHSSELLLGQLFPDDKFTNSGLTGNEHRKHALPLVIQWLDWKIQFGFSEWHSNTYLEEDMGAIMNLIDFAEDTEVVTKAAMIMDIITFNFANQYYNNRYATSMGRAYDSKFIGTSEDNPAQGESVREAAWVLLGVGEHDRGDTGNRGAVGLATSKRYAPPPILEAIANDSRDNIEHRERNSIYIDEGDKYGIEYNEEDLMFWWGMSAPVAPPVIRTSFKVIDKYGINTNTIIGPPIVMDFFRVSAFLHGTSVSKYSSSLRAFTQGIALETANIYTYRTPDYQLSGAQDHQKGMNSFQEHIWQATLDDNAFVFTNSPGGLTKNFNQLYMGGWMPRATLYKNIGVIQYDREMMPMEAEALIFMLNLYSGLNVFNEKYAGFKDYNHAYFPRWAFDEVESYGSWTFGAKDDGYIALYSYNPTWWASDFELRSPGQKNVWIVELGSKDDDDSFEDFMADIKKANVNIESENLGYKVSYKSPSQGRVKVSWDDPFEVDGEEIDLGDYDKYDNQYCHQKFGTKVAVIEFGNERLELNFNNNTRLYQK